MTTPPHHRSVATTAAGATTHGEENTIINGFAAPLPCSGEGPLVPPTGLCTKQHTSVNGSDQSRPAHSKTVTEEASEGVAC